MFLYLMKMKPYIEMCLIAILLSIKANFIIEDGLSNYVCVLFYMRAQFLFSLSIVALRLTVFF